MGTSGALEYTRDGARTYGRTRSRTIAEPTLVLDFLRGGTLDPRITFTRASTATFFNSVGVLTSAAINEARFDYNPSTLAPLGLLIEEARTNSILQSEDFATTWIAISATVTADAIVAPSGATTGDKMIVNSGVSSGNSSLRQDVTKAASAIALTLSMFAKKDEADTLRMLPRDAAASANNVDARFNLNDGTVISVTAAGTFTNASAAIQNVGNGWYRCSVTFTSGTETSIRSQVFQLKSGANFTGNGTDGIYIWGYQFEAGAFPTSYIPTTTIALTRSADVASMTGTNFSSWFNASEGTIFCQGIGVNNVATGTRRYFEINNNTPDERFLAGYGFTTSCRYLVSDGAATQADIGVTTTTGGVLVKFAGAYKTNDFQQASNGTLGTADTSGTLPTVDRMFIGQAETTAAATMLNGYIQRIAYYPTRLANEQLQALTA